ncbi:tetratricopeptide repeat protein [Candidatus Latescibacterota bacterium]
MKITNILLIMILYHNFVVSANDTLVPVEMCNAISDFILSGNYDLAENAADSLISAQPDEPIGPLLKASVLQYECIDYEDFSREEDFYRLLDTTEKNAEKQMNLDRNDLWARYFLCASYGLRGARASITGQFVYGVIKGRSGAMGMRDIIIDDPDFYDAYLLFGSYRFWKSVVIGSVTWFPFIEDESTVGISEVKKSIEYGVLTGPLSNTVLIEMYLSYNPELAVDLAEEMLELYPSCRLFSWQLGEAYKRLGSYDDAERIFSGIALSMKDDKRDDGSGELRSWWKLAVLANSVGKTEECLYYCNKIIDLGERESVFKRQRERINKAIRMKEVLENE